MARPCNLFRNVVEKKRYKKIRKKYLKMKAKVQLLEAQKLEAHIKLQIQASALDAIKKEANIIGHHFQEHQEFGPDSWQRILNVAKYVPEIVDNLPT
jgi:hypothetical protein